MSAEWIRTETRVFSGISNLGEILGSTARFLCGLLGHLQLQVTNSSLFSSLTLSNCRWFNLAILKLSCLRLIALWLWWRPREKQQAVSLAISRRMPTIVKTINSSKYDWSIYILEIYFDTLIKWQLVCQMITWSDPEDFNYASHSIPPEDFSAKFLLTTLGHAWVLIGGLELESFLVIKLLRFVSTNIQRFQDPGLFDTCCPFLPGPAIQKQFWSLDFLQVFLLDKKLNLVF